MYSFMNFFNLLNKPSEEFLAFKQANPTWEKKLGIYQRDSFVYKRIPYRWANKHKAIFSYHTIINTKTGDLYIDCRRRKIFVKQVAALFIRPLHTCLAKTLWEIASLIPRLLLNTYDLAQREISFITFAARTVTAFTDIVRTPLYGIALTVCHLFSIALGLLAPTTLYYTREITGNLELAHLRKKSIFDRDGNPRSWALVGCFTPLGNLLAEGSSPEEISSNLQNFAKSQIKFRRRTNAIFNDCGLILPKGASYLSAAAPKLHWIVA